MRQPASRSAPKAQGEQTLAHCGADGGRQLSSPTATAFVSPPPRVGQQTTGGTPVGCYSDRG